MRRKTTVAPRIADGSRTPSIRAAASTTPTILGVRRRLPPSGGGTDQTDESRSVRHRAMGSQGPREEAIQHISLEIPFVPGGPSQIRTCDAGVLHTRNLTYEEIEAADLHRPSVPGMHRWVTLTVGGINISHAMLMGSSSSHPYSTISG